MKHNEKNAKCLGISYHKECDICQRYAAGDDSLVRMLEFTERGLTERTLRDTEIAFVLSGKYLVSIKNVKNYLVEAESIILLPMGTHIVAQVLEPGKVFVCRLRYIMKICESFKGNYIYEQNPELDSKIQTLPFNGQIRLFLDSFLPHIDNGLRCVHYVESKFTELLFLLRAYYTEEELAEFFYLLMSSDIMFKEIIMENYSQVQSVQDLARMTFYSNSGFHKHFKKTFGVNPSQWLGGERAKLLRDELTKTEKPIKEISYQLGFSSVSHLNKFCKKHFGSTPIQIRTKG